MHLRRHASLPTNQQELFRVNTHLHIHLTQLVFLPPFNRRYLVLVCVYIYINSIYRYKCLLYLYNCYYMLLYHISTPRNISNAASQHLLSKLKFLLKPLMLYLYKKHLVNFIIISFTIQTSTQTSYTPEK